MFIRTISGGSRPRISLRSDSKSKDGRASALPIVSLRLSNSYRSGSVSLS